MALFLDGFRMFPGNFGEVIGEFGALMCLDAPEDEVAEFGFAVALALQRSPKQCQLTLKDSGA